MSDAVPVLPEDPHATYELRAAILSAWTPSSPIDNRDLFAGRTDQIDRVIDIVFQRGQHGAVYGERGVGKTSLAKVGRTIATQIAGDLAVGYYTCNAESTFGSIFSELFTQIRLAVTAKQSPGFTSEVDMHLASIAELLGGQEIGIDVVRRSLEAAATDGRVVLFVDEFDRVADATSKTAMADLIKSLSDGGVDATIILIGVADNIVDLVGAHASIDRALAQIEMPRMGDDELALIVDRGAHACAIDVEPAFTDQVIRLSQGLPHYVHLLAQHGALAMLDEGEVSIAAHHLKPAISSALDQISASVRDRYMAATSSNRKENLFRQVILACAKAPKDDLGRFGSADVRRPLRELTGRDYDIPAYAQHLNDFSGDGPRGGILMKTGTTRRFKYQFIDPLLPPYVMMRSEVEE